MNAVSRIHDLCVVVIDDFESYFLRLLFIRSKQLGIVIATDIVQRVRNIVEVSMLRCDLSKETLGAAACCMSCQYIIFEGEHLTEFYTASLLSSSRV